MPFVAASEVAVVIEVFWWICKLKTTIDRIGRVTPAAWLARLRHDLVKRLLWPARDRSEMGGAPAPGELVPSLIDGEGRPVSAEALWQSMRADAPGGVPAQALDAFGSAHARALAAAAAGDVARVLAFEADVDALAQVVRSLDGTG
jgi:hypothetical protein